MTSEGFSETDLKKFLKVSLFLSRLRLENLFHLYTLIFAICMFVFFANYPNWLSLLNVILIFVGLWMQLFQAFIIRFTIGLSDKYPRAYTLNYNWKMLRQGLPKVNMKAQILQSITFVVGLSLLAILGYSAIHFETSKLIPESFRNGPLSIVDSMYFSIVSFATVGY